MVNEYNLTPLRAHTDSFFNAIHYIHDSSQPQSKNTCRENKSERDRGKI